MATVADYIDMDEEITDDSTLEEQYDLSERISKCTTLEEVRLLEADVSNSGLDAEGRKALGIELRTRAMQIRDDALTDEEVEEMIRKAKRQCSA